MPYNRTVPRICARCGADFLAIDQAVKRGKGTFCSRRCSRIVRDASAVDRLWSRVDKNGPIHPYNSELGPCWIYTGSKVGGGYGAIPNGGVSTGAHRLSWTLYNGPIPDGLLVCHTCDNPPCVNPTHLFLGTHDDNSTDKISKGRHARGDTSGSRLHPERLPRGEDNHFTKLTTEQVIEIRKLHASGENTNDLASRYGVNRSYIYSIGKRRTWKHVP